MAYSRRFGRFLPFFAGLGLILINGCGGSSSKSKPAKCPSGEAPTTSQALADLPGDSSIVTLRVDPFATPGNPAIAWFAPAGVPAAKALRFAPPATVEGFHWEWKLAGEARLWLARENNVTGRSVTTVSWSDGCAVKLESIGSESPRVAASGARAIGFALDTDSPPTSAAWPAVVGLGNGESKALSVVALSPVMPQDPAARLRIEFVNSDPKKVKVISRATSCGPLCLEFPNYLAAMDSPFFVTRNPANVYDETAPEGVRLAGMIRAAAPDGGVIAGKVESCQSAFRAALENAGKMFQLLRSRWPTPKLLTDRYDIYVVQKGGLKTYQGLEHSGSTLISIAGDCASESYLTSLSKVIAHEMVHAWNVRHLYPKEHGTYSAASFEAARTSQLYFYEGWTEGYARVALAEQGQISQASRLTDWNQSLSALYSAFDLAADKPVKLNLADANNAFGQYQTGAAFLLFVAMQLRLQSAADSDGESKSRTRLWQLLEDLRKRADAGQQVTSWDDPPWLRRPWSGLVASPDASGRYGSGYAAADVAAVLTEAVGSIDGTGGDAVGISRTQFAATLAAFSQKFSVPLVSKANSNNFFEIPADGTSLPPAWPL